MRSGCYIRVHIHTTMRIVTVLLVSGSLASAESTWVGGKAVL